MIQEGIRLGGLMPAAAPRMPPGMIQGGIRLSGLMPAAAPRVPSNVGIYKTQLLLK